MAETEEPGEPTARRRLRLPSFGRRQRPASLEEAVEPVQTEPKVTGPRVIAYQPDPKKPPMQVVEYVPGMKPDQFRQYQDLFTAELATSVDPSGFTQDNLTYLANQVDRNVSRRRGWRAVTIGALVLAVLAAGTAVLEKGDNARLKGIIGRYANEIGIKDNVIGRYERLFTNEYGRPPGQTGPK